MDLIWILAELRKKFLYTLIPFYYILHNVSYSGGSLQFRATKVKITVICSNMCISSSDQLFLFQGLEPTR